MANNKVGFSYYSVDTDRYQDIKIKRLKKEHGCAGIAVYDYILNEIYRVKGCFIEFDDNACFDVAEYFGIEESEVGDIIDACCSIGLFDSGNFRKNKIITSISIQKRFVDWSKKAKRSDVSIPDLVVIIQEELPKLPEESAKLPEESSDYSCSLPQSKVKESKGKERKEEKSKKETPKWRVDLSLLDLPFDSDSFKNAWGEFCGHRVDIKKPMTERAAKSILKELEQAGEPAALLMIQKSIIGGWTGVFPLKPEDLKKVADAGGAKNTPTTNDLNKRYGMYPEEFRREYSARLSMGLAVNDQYPDSLSVYHEKIGAPHALKTTDWMVATITLPHSSIGFRSTWVNWVKVRGSLGKTLDLAAADLQIKLLASKDEPIALLMLQKSIGGGYSNIFELKREDEWEVMDKIIPTKEAKREWLKAHYGNTLDPRYSAGSPEQARLGNMIL